MQDKLGMQGNLHLEVLGPDGKLKKTVDTPNTIMNAGKAVCSGLLLNDVGGEDFDWIAIGTGTTAPNATQTALVGEKYRSSGTGTQITTTTTDDTAQLSSSFNLTSSISVAESGMFNSSSAGDMMARTTFSAIPVNSGDTINAVWKIQFS